MGQLFRNARVHAGDGGHNVRWRWHLRDVRLGAVAIEVCDGRPSMVEVPTANWPSSEVIGIVGERHA